MTSSKTETAAENTESAAPICGFLRRDGIICKKLPFEGSDRCMFHRNSKQDVEKAQAAGETTLPDVAQRIAARMATADAGPVYDPAETDELPGEPTPPAPEASLHAARLDGPAPDGDAPEGYVKRWVIDGGEYVEKLFPIADEPRVSVKDPRAFTDAFALGDAYREGQAARFDFRWSNRKEQINELDAEHGYIPQTVALDNRFTVKDGAVSFGDLILMKRPKELTEKRARDLALRSSDREQQEFAEFEEEASRNGLPAFGGVSESRGDFTSENDPETERRLAARRAPEPARPAGRMSFAFPNNPLGRDLVAERHKAVGG